MDEAIVRAASAADVAATTAIYADEVLHGTATFEIDPPDEAEMARRMTALTDAGYPYLVAVRNGSIAGYSYAGPYRPRPAYRHTVEDSVYIAADRRGEGIGRMLLLRLIEECTRLGFRQMIAVIGDSANAASVRLHERAGFDPAGVLKNVGYKHSRWLDSVLMQRPLGAGAGTAPER